MALTTTDYQARYFAWELTRRRCGGYLDRIGQSIFDAPVDLNPQQIEAALFALQNPLSKGVLLAGEDVKKILRALRLDVDAVNARFGGPGESRDAEFSL